MKLPNNLSAHSFCIFTGDTAFDVWTRVAIVWVFWQPSATALRRRNQTVNRFSLFEKVPGVFHPRYCPYPKPTEKNYPNSNYPANNRLIIMIPVHWISIFVRNLCGKFVREIRTVSGYPSPG